MTPNLENVRALNCTYVRVKQDGSVEAADTDNVRNYEVKDTLGLQKVWLKLELISHLESNIINNGESES